MLCSSHLSFPQIFLKSPATSGIFDFYFCKGYSRYLTSHFFALVRRALFGVVCFLHSLAAGCVL